MLSFGASPHKYKFVSTLLEKGEKDASDSDGDQYIDLRREYMFKEQPEQESGSVAEPTLRLSKDMNSSQIPNYLPPPDRSLNLEDRIS